MMRIESSNNPKIKNIIKLQQKSRERKKQQLFVVEGVQENQLALDSGWEIHSVFLCDTLWENQFTLPTTEIFVIPKNLYEKLSYRSTTEGIIGIYRTKKNTFESLKLNGNDLFIVLEGVEKPGNLGAILRSCDGAGVSAVFLCDEKVDFTNPNVIRSSVGTVFTMPIITETKENLIHWFKQNKVQVLPTFLRGDTKNLYDFDFKQSTAFVLGTETSGLSDDWLNFPYQTLKIPMSGKVDSLNVSNAAAICMYEWVRQNLD